MKYFLAYTALLSFCFASETPLRIPLHSFPFLSDQRFIEIQVDGHQYLALIDTGSAFSMIRKDALNEVLNKSYICDSEYIGITGKKYTTADFKISSVKIGDFYTETVFKEEDENFWTEGCATGVFSFIESAKIYLMYQVRREALLGVDLFQKFACLFDFPHSSIFLAADISDLIGNLSEFCAIAFEMGKAGVILTLQTALGEKRFLLDSAATTSLIRSSPPYRTLLTKLSTKSIHLGTWRLVETNLASEFDDIDGILGIDFFKKNMIGLSFESNMAYIRSPELGSKERFTYWLKSFFGK
jgi:hypothetical protein